MNDSTGTVYQVVVNGSKLFIAKREEKMLRQFYICMVFLHHDVQQVIYFSE